MFSTQYDEVLPPSGTASAHVAGRLTATLDAACPQWRDAVRDYVKQVSEPTVVGPYIKTTWRGQSSRARDNSGRAAKIGRADRATGVSLLTGNPTMLLELAIASGAAADQTVTPDAMLETLTKLRLAPYAVEGPKPAQVARTHLMPHQRPKPRWMREMEEDGYRHVDRGFDHDPVNTISLLESYVLEASDMLLADDLADPTDVTGGRAEIAGLLGEAARTVSAGRMLSEAREAVARSLRAGELSDAMREDLASRASILTAEYDACSAQAVKAIASIISASSVYEQLRSSHAKMLEQAAKETEAMSSGAAALEAAEQAISAAAGVRAVTIGSAAPAVTASKTAARAARVQAGDETIDVPDVHVLEVAMYSGASIATVKALASALKTASPARSSEQAAAGAYEVINDAIGRAAFPEDGLEWLGRNLATVTKLLESGVPTQEAVTQARNSQAARDQMVTDAVKRVTDILSTESFQHPYTIGRVWPQTDVRAVVADAVARCTTDGETPDKSEIVTAALTVLGAAEERDGLGSLAAKIAASIQAQRRAAAAARAVNVAARHSSTAPGRNA